MSQCQNGAPPMFLPITNVTVALDQNPISRGIAVSIGTPPQQVALRPSAADDDLYPVNRAACSPNYTDACIGYFGGVFTPSSSSTFRQVTQGQWNGTAEANPLSLSEIYFNDVLSFGNVTAYGFPALLDQPGYGGQGTLPLGWKSDFLKIAFAMGSIPSKAYAIWTGSRSIDFPVDGSLVLGGYDTTRYTGEPTTFPATERCSACAVVVGLTYDNENGSSSLFSNSSESLQIGLNPSQEFLYVTPDIFANFANVTGGVFDSALGGLVYSASNPPTGNLTVVLSNNYTTTITAADLFAYPRSYDDQGRYTISNNTVFLADILPQNNTGYVYDWGIPYLTMNYLFMDFARNQFQMAPAVRTNFQSQGGGYVLQAVCDPGLPASTTSSTSASATPTSSSTPKPVPTHNGGSNNVGAIVGGVVGGVLGLILIVGVLGFLFYRSRQRRRSAGAGAEVAVPVAKPARDNEKEFYGSNTDGRNSHLYPPTSPTEGTASELYSDKRGGDAHVSEWLSSHGSETAASADMDRPFEMPAGDVGRHFKTEGS